MNSPLDTTAKTAPKIEGMIMDIPNNNPANNEPKNRGANSAKNPETVRRLIPNIENAKCLLLIENVPPVKPNAKPRIPKIPMNTQSKPTVINPRIPMKAATQEAMIVRIPAAIGKSALFFGGGG